MKIIKPPKLQKGDTIGIVSPSQPIHSQDQKYRFQEGINFLEKQWGLKTKLGKHVFDQYFYSAGTAEQRADDFNTMWADPEIKMILMTVGGHTASEILDKLDYDLMQRQPKIFTGISDGTTLLNAIHAKTGLVTYHGPDLCYGFGKLSEPMIEKQLHDCFFGKEMNLSPVYRSWKTIRSGKATGNLIGGHNTILLELLGSGFLKPSDFDGKILALEGTANVRGLAGQLYFMKLSGVFDNLAGIILGHFDGSQGEILSYNRPVADILLEATSEFNFPIIEIKELGHCVENYCFPIGCQATIDADALKITIDELAVQ